MSMLTKTARRVYYILIGITCLVSVIVTIEVIIDYRIQYEKDMQCVHKLVKSGLERSDIKQIGGKCYVGENFYYKYP